MNINPIDNSVYIPIIVGVSGHRDINKDHIEELRKTIKEVLSHIKTENPYSPIKLLTPLAEGADRIVAKVAIELNIELIVPLPMPQEEYMKDFSDDDSRKEFENLLCKATRYFELSEANKDYKDSKLEKKKSRDICYFQTGLYIAKNCQILLALWDGKETEGIGGTSSIIKLKLNGTNDEYTTNEDSISQIESGPVYHIVTPRNGDEIIDDDIFSLKIHYPNYWKDESKAVVFYERVLNSINSFNKHIYFPKKINDEKKLKLLNNNLSNMYDFMNDFEKSLFYRFTFTDLLARQFKLYRTIALRLLLLIIVIAFFFFHIYLTIHPNIFILSMYPFLLGVASFIYLLAKKKDYEIKHEDYRALSEAIRVQIYWNINGISKNVADYFLQKHKGDLEWIKYALRNWTKSEFYSTLTSHSNKINKNNEVELNKLSLKYWVDDQRDWYFKQGNLNHKKHHRLEIIANYLFGFGIFFALLLIAYEFNKYLLQSASASFLIHHMLVLLISLCLTCAAAFHGYTEKMVFSEQAKQYKRMFDLFNFVSDKMHDSVKKNDYLELKKNFFELGTESLMENADWLLIHRSRPLEFPKS